MIKHWLGALAGIVLAVLASTAQADTIQFETAAGHTGPGSFEGSMDYAYSSGLYGTLTITLKNTSDAGNGGYLTGFVFNVDGSALLLLGEARGSAWQQLWGNNGLALNPYGDFEVGASTSNKVSSNKNASDGIGVGDERTFTFYVFGSDRSTLQAADFFSESSTGAHGSTAGEVFMARFGAFGDGDSDKTPGQIRVVPLPSAGLAGLFLLIGLGVRRRRRAAA